MNTKDFLIYENGDGGELAVSNNDLMLGESLFMQPYLALFGGNVESNTNDDSLTSTELKSDYWGNDLFWKDSPSKQFNSNTERLLNNIVMNNTGRLDLERAIKNDLSYLSPVVDVSVSVKLMSINKIDINITFIQKNNKQQKAFSIVYDNAAKALIKYETI